MLKTKSGQKVSSTKNLSGFNNLKKQFNNAENEIVKIGFPAKKSETLSEEDGVTALFKATVNNYGLGTPKRPFMDITFAQNIDKYRMLVRKYFRKIPQNQVLAKVGNLALSDLRMTIKNFNAPRNSDYTIAKKGADNPLIDTTHMIDSTTYSIEKEK